MLSEILIVLAIWICFFANITKTPPITFDAYLKIFTTSFLGAIFFKILILIFGIPALNELLLNLGLPVANDDFQNYLVELSVIGVDKFVTIVFLAIFLFSFFYKKV